MTNGALRPRLNLLTLLALLTTIACGGAPADTPPATLPAGSLIADWPAAARPAPGRPTGLPAGFSDGLVVGELDQPTALRFLPSGDLVVAEQRGVVTRFGGTDFAGSNVLIDVRTAVFNWNQFGLLGLGIDPEFGDEPYIYLAFTLDAGPAGAPPVHGVPGADSDDCPGGRLKCVSSGRLSRFRMEQDAAAAEEVLLEDWCFIQNHTVGTIAFAPDGALLLGSGDGADGRDVDFGQSSTPPNACDDPPVTRGVAPEPRTSEGGSLRSQDLATRSDPLTLDGTLLRLDRATGDGLGDNPLGDDEEANARRVIATGLRNPFRFTIRPGTSEIWIADVGWTGFEEINRIEDPLAGPPRNLGWPCYEGPRRQPDFDHLENGLCEALYESEPEELLFPYVSFGRPPAAEGSCESGGAATSALAFYDGTVFPDQYADALFFGDSARRCIWVMPIGADGLPDPDGVAEFLVGAGPVDLQVGPDGALYYADNAAGEIRRITFSGQ